jgi:hypothetical protein
VFNYLCAAVASGKKALVWLEVFGGGFGGLIARHRPGIEPDPASMRATIEEWCRNQGKPIGRALADYEMRGSDTPMIADDADVTVIAAHAARFSIDTLISPASSVFPNSVYLIGLAGGWIFEQPFDTRPIDVGIVPPAAPAMVDEQTVQEERARITKIFQGLVDAATADTSDSPTTQA